MMNDAFSESFSPFRAESNKFYIYRQQTNIVFIQTVFYPFFNKNVKFPLYIHIIAFNSKKTPIDVVLLSRNSADTGLRIFNCGLRQP
jgi:5'-nucleotidase